MILMKNRFSKGTQFLQDICEWILTNYLRQIIFFLSSLLIIILVTFVYSEVKRSHAVPKEQIVISKDQLETLVNQAAEQKYQQKVLEHIEDLPKLPMPDPQPVEISNDKKIKTTEKAPSAVIQRCFYKNQDYSLGEIVKSDEGWLRCTQTFVFTPDDLKQLNDMGWVAVR